ncbi:hypothetical protein L596_028654 [Steinernema carpocapsae]|uniref:RING-type domain-containing protein n=1 Tax=Steinernema carpocapsae TaxID=34508 RepID=A0A4U5LZ20_STECR|nr:hypothetical protein L596_028654 [Steinernema carpocapsae]
MEDLLQTFPCVVCNQKLHDPLLPMCGHNVCKACFDNTERCPLNGCGEIYDRAAKNTALTAALKTIEKLTFEKSKMKMKTEFDCVHCRNPLVVKLKVFAKPAPKSREPEDVRHALPSVEAAESEAETEASEEENSRSEPESSESQASDSEFEDVNSEAETEEETPDNCQSAVLS